MMACGPMHLAGVYNATIEKEEFEFIKAKAQVINEIEVSQEADDVCLYITPIMPKLVTCPPSVSLSLPLALFLDRPPS